MNRFVGSSAVAVYLTILVLGLGIARLVYDEPYREPLSEKDAKQVTDECLPKVDIMAGETVSLSSAGGKLQAIALRPMTVSLTKPVPAGTNAVSLAKEELTLAKPESFELRLTDGAAFVRTSKGAALAVRAPARFGPADDTSYPIMVAVKSKEAAAISSAENEPRANVDVKTALGTVEWGSGHSVVTAQPLSASISMTGTLAVLAPERISGQSGQADLAIDARASDLLAERPGVVLWACAARPGKSKWAQASATIEPAAAGQPKRILVSLPSDALPPAGAWFEPVVIALASSDGRAKAIGGIRYVGRAWAAAVASLLTGILLAIVMYNRGQRVKQSVDGSQKPRWIAGLFIGADNEPSLSLLQVFIWTTITVWGYFYVFIVAGKLLSLTPDMMILLGIAGVGTVLARWVGTAGRSSQPAANSGHDFWRMLSTNGSFDLLKLQLFVFTVVIAIFVVSQIAQAAAFPKLDANTLLLLGVSQGVYVGGKMVAGSGLQKAQAIKAELDLLVAEKTKLSDEKLEDTLKATTTALAEKSSRISALQSDYDKALTELGLKRV